MPRNPCAGQRLAPRGQGPCPRGLHRHPHVYDARHDDASRLATMGCRICLDAYTPDERPAALPCGHVFHHACLQDWLTTRTHGAVPSGCPLCKAPATLADLERPRRRYEPRANAVPELYAGWRQALARTLR